MSMKRLVLSFAVLTALAGPALLSQEYTGGIPEDIAAVLPEETVVFVELTRPGKLLRDWKEYVGAFCTKEGKANVTQQIEKAVKDALVEAPEKLLKDFDKGFPVVQRVAVAMGRPRGGDEPFLAVVASASNETFFKTLVDDLKVFAAEERPHQGTTILTIRKLGKHDLGGTLCLAALGKRLVLSPHVDSVIAVLDRAAGKWPGPDLRKNAAYARFSPSAGEDPSLRAFADLKGLGVTDLFGGRSWGYRRVSAHQQDVTDAALGLRKIRGASLEATFAPGKIAATTRIAIDSGCPLYDVWRQPAGPKELLKLLPADSQVMAHLNLKSGKEVLGDIQGIVKRYMEIEMNAASREKPPRPDEDSFKQEFERHLGAPLDDIAAAIGAEAAFAMVGEDAVAGEQNMVESLLFVVALADPEKARTVVEKVTKKLGAYETRKDGDATFYVPAQEGGNAVFGIQGKIGLIGTKVDVLKKALKTLADGTGLTKQLPAGAASASKMIGYRPSALWSMIRMASRGKLPDLSKDLDMSGLSVILITEEKNQIALSSMDPGLGLGVQVSLMAMPVFITVAFSSGGRFVAENDEGVGKKGPAVKESPPLPAEQLDAQVKKHLAGMRSDEVVTREDAEIALKALGAQAAKLLAEAVRKETDTEVKGRILKILSEWRAYDAFPELLKTKVDGFMAAFQKATGVENGRMPSWIQWRQQGTEFPYGMEPMYWDTGFVSRLEHADLLDAPQGVRALAERLSDGKLNTQMLRNLCAVFAFHDCRSAADLVLAAREKIEDGEAKTYLQIALGWSDDPKARGALYAGLKDADLWARRASFIGLERTKDSAAIPKLMDLLSDKDPETRWNASFTLRELTGGKASVNIYLPEVELKASMDAARAWWEANKSTYRIGE
jgi:hypothetical protein